MFTPPSCNAVVALIVGDVTDVPTVIAAEKEGAPALATRTVFAAPCAVTCTADVLFP